jgi:hypothetical protein
MKRAKLLLWGAAATIALGSGSAMASVVVVKSLGPSAKAYPPGKTLPETAKITLQGGDVLTVLGPGSATTLRGPGNFEAKSVTLASASNRRGRFGALRAAEVAKNPSVWDIDVSQSGKVCVSSASKVQLWRPTSEDAVTVQIRKPDGTSEPVTWASGSALTAWPTGLAIKNGVAYSVEWPETGDKSNLEFVSVDAPPADMVGTAQVLIANGCQNQLDLLVASAGKAS